MKRLLKNAQHLSQANAWNELCNVRHATRKMCARVRTCVLYTHRRVHACCYWLSAKSVLEILQDYSGRLVSVVEAVRTSFPVPFATSLTLIPPILVLQSMRVPFLQLMMMVVGVLNFAVAQSTPPGENLTIPIFFGLHDPLSGFDESLILIEYKVLLVLQHIEDFQERFLLL